MDRLIQIVPSLPPRVNGLGDHALNVASELRDRHNILTTFVVSDTAWDGRGDLNGFGVHRLNERNAGALSDLLSKIDRESPVTAVLLHYVGYAYAKRGCPFWLIDGFEQWKNGSKNRRLITIFHELFASGPPWGSAFWLSAVQRHLARKLCAISDFSLTSLTRYAAQLRAWEPSNRIVSLPVFSNVGEPADLPPLNMREPRMIVFGSQHNRRRVYEQSMKHLVDACEALQLEEIYDVGPKFEELPRLPIRIVQIGNRSAEEISRLFLTSIAGFFDYTPGFWAKSGILAAYCAHGLVPISPRILELEEDGIVPNRTVLLCANLGLKVGQTQAQEIARTAHEWYGSHTKREFVSRLVPVLHDQVPCAS